MIPTTLTRRTATRRRTFVLRLVAALALLAWLGSAAETVGGMLRDGIVHHESSALAAAHTGSGGEHGHEDGPASDHAKHGAGHQHGTSADHCTHQHGTPLPASPAPAPGAWAEAAVLPDPPGRLAHVSTAHFRPPRA